MYNIYNVYIHTIFHSINSTVNQWTDLSSSYKNVQTNYISLKCPICEKNMHVANTVTIKALDDEDRTKQRETKAWNDIKRMKFWYAKQEARKVGKQEQIQNNNNDNNY